MTSGVPSSIPFLRHRPQEAPMRSLCRSVLALGFGLALLATGPAPSARAAEDAKVDGSWKLVLLPPLQEVDFVIVDVASEGGKATAKVKAAQKFFPSEPTVENFAVKGDAVSFGMKIGDSS